MKERKNDEKTESEQPNVAVLRSYVRPQNIPDRQTDRQTYVRLSSVRIGRRDGEQCCHHRDSVHSRWRHVNITSLWSFRCLWAPRSATPSYLTYTAISSHLISSVLLSTHANRQRVDISCTVCLCVCTGTDFSAEDRTSGVKFCTAVYRRPRQEISHFCELCSPRSRKSDELASSRATPTRM